MALKKDAICLSTVSAESGECLDLVTDEEPGEDPVAGAGLGPAGSEGSVGGVGFGGEVATTPPPPPTGGNRYRGCHHLRPAGGPSDPQLQSGGTRAAERTQSNPEIDYCPVCLARKEGEILLKRTYSRRNTEVNHRKQNDH